MTESKQPQPPPTTPKQFRLSEDTVADLDLIAEWLQQEHGGSGSRSDAVRYAARQVAEKIRRKTR